MLRPKNETEDFLLGLTKKCETPFEQIHAEPQEKLELKLTHQRELFSFSPPIPVEVS